MGILRTFESDIFKINQYDDKVDHYSATCKQCGTLGWNTGRCSVDSNGKILYNMSILCPKCKCKETVSVFSDTNPSEKEKQI